MKSPGEWAVSKGIGRNPEGQADPSAPCLPVLTNVHISCRGRVRALGPKGFIRVGLAEA